MSLYDFTVTDTSNKGQLRFSQFKGKVVLIVNVASLCGFTVQYKDLEYLYEKYQDQGFEVVGFPCNQFGGQEPCNTQEIVRNCKRDFGVTFRIVDKIEVNGDLEDPLYTFLKRQKQTGLGFKGVRWNFEKFLVSREGKVVGRYDSAVTPLQIEPFIQTLIDQHVDI